MAIPSKVRDRLVASLKRYQPILGTAKTRDINESDTVTIVKDILGDLFGYDKYTEITSEFAIRGTYVDLAVRLEGQLEMLIEVKAIGLDLKEAFVKQAVDYAANQGIEWVILTNGVLWDVFRVSFKQPIEQERVVRVDLLACNAKIEDDLESLYMLTKEGVGKAALGAYHQQRQVLSRYFLGALILSESVLDVIRRELRRMSPDVRIENDQISAVLLQEVLKREVVEGDRADDARRKINRAAGRALRRPTKNTTNGITGESQIQTQTPEVISVNGTEPLHE